MSKSKLSFYLLEGNPEQAVFQPILLFRSPFPYFASPAIEEHRFPLLNTIKKNNWLPSNKEEKA
jgi:hypothetical protein